MREWGTALKKKSEYNLAISLVKRKQYYDALDRFKNLIKHNRRVLPDILIPLYRQLAANYHNLNIRLLIAELYICDGDYKEAVNELEEVFEIDYKFTQVYFLLSKIYSKNGQKDRIKYIFENAFKKDIMDSVIIDLLPRIYLEEEDLDKSIGFYEELIEKHSQTIKYQRTLAELYIKAAQYEKAILIYEQIAKLLPKDTHGIAGRCEQLIEYCPNSILIRRILAEMYFSIYDFAKGIFFVKHMLELDSSVQPEAIDIYRNVLELYPDTSEVIFAMAEVLVESSRYTEGVNYLQILISKNEFDHQLIKDLLETILERYPDQILAWQLLSDIFYSKHDYAETLDCIEKMVFLDSSGSINVQERLLSILNMDKSLQNKCRYLLAKHFFYKKEHKKCLAECAVLTGTDYENQAKCIQADVEKDAGNLVKSKKILLSVFQGNKYNWDIYQNLVELHRKIIDEQKDVKQGFRSPDAHNKLFNSGLIHLRKGDLFAALENFQKVSVNADLRFKAYMLISRCFLEMGRFDLSINQLMRLLPHLEKKDRDISNTIRYFISVNYINMGDIAEAISYLESIMEDDVNFPNIRGLLEWYKQQSVLTFSGKALSGCLWSNDNRSVSVLSVPNMEKASLLKKKQPDTQYVSFAYPHNNRGVEYLIKKHIKAAEDEFNLAVQMEPDFTVAYCNLSILSLLKEETGQAIDHLRKAEELNKNLDLVYLNLGLVFLVQKNYDLAKEHFLKALSINPQNHLAKLNIGDIYFFMKDLKRAFDYWQSSMSTGTLFYFIQRRLGHLLSEGLTFNYWSNDFNLQLYDFLNGDS
ncbi:MAG: tetratricopeptide repeat protein [bacterium]|nr:tetratricopeptide repeat protein [bacterium]